MYAFFGFRTKNWLPAPEHPPLRSSLAGQGRPTTCLSGATPAGVEYKFVKIVIKLTISKYN
jgi:hypothetical protein